MGKQRETILANESGPKAGVEGVVEDVKGRAKEAAGAVSGNESLKQEGEAQQDKAAAQRDVAAKEAEAVKARLAVNRQNEAPGCAIMKEVSARFPPPAAGPTGSSK